MNRYEVVLETDVGRERRENEDSSLSLFLELAGQPAGQPVLLAAVADGMGGHSNGRLASRMALRALAAGVTQGLSHAPLEGPDALTEAQVTTLLAEAVQGAADQLARAEQHGLVDMGTTLCAALLIDNQAFIANVGDSRAYLIAAAVQQITTDHSVVARLVAEGQLTPEEAKTHPRKNEIYRMLGFGRPSQPDFFCLDLEPGDVLLLCSDGLTTYADDSDLGAAIADGAPLRTAARHLIDLANQRGGEDNITVALVRVTGGDTP